MQKSGSQQAVGELNEVLVNAGSAAALLKSLANPHRLMVLCVLASEQREMCVSELNDRIALSQSALSQHLARLRGDNLVTTRRDSQTIYYSVSEGPAMELIQVLQHYYCEK
ncbi:ArsR/SmtB family transcription factor [Teredinibacter franksiae]|jgi:transcriptional regulator, ArsR family|uniref:ArsR/SmtB family transcription factor n=1 Tax=Teredinibacter franksiae TaxID=2761453 RepID=UPI0016260EDC|nr:metalloregulator ArsR/SmtB family transcription factor [Teredinibacter franksiae]